MTERSRLADSADSMLFDLAAAASASPVWLHLLLADRCNHSCLHCYQVQGLKGELSREQIEKVLREFRAAGGFVVSFSGGEATLREDLLDLLAYAHRLGLATVLYTNGFTMTRQRAADLARANVWRVEISLYSDVAEEHDATTLVPGSWQKTTEGVRWLRANGVNVILKFTPTASSTADAARMVELARELDAHIIVSELVAAGEAGRDAPTRARRSPDRAIGARTEHPSDRNGLDRAPCGIGGASLRVRSDGQVQPCTMVHVPMGQIGDSETPLATALSSDVAQFFAQVTWSDIHGCRECDLRAHCTRCFGSAAAEAGDMLAPYRAACELAVARYRALAGDKAILAGRNEGAPDRDGSIGPYRVEPGGELSPAADRITARDEALRKQHPWLCPSKEALEVAACGTSPARLERGLVQLRRRKTIPVDATGTPT